MPVFDVTTGVNISALGVVPGDTVYVAGASAHLNVNTAVSLKQIVLGHLSTGAAPANERYGLLSLKDNITFDGNANPSLSGIYCDPTSYDASSIRSKVYLFGTESASVILTNSVGMYDPNYLYDICLNFGSVFGQGRIKMYYPNYGLTGRFANSLYTDNERLVLLHYEVYENHQDSMFFHVGETDIPIDIYNYYWEPRAFGDVLVFKN